MSGLVYDIIREGFTFQYICVCNCMDESEFASAISIKQCDYVCYGLGSTDLINDKLIVHLFVQESECYEFDRSPWHLELTMDSLFIYLKNKPQ